MATLLFDFDGTICDSAGAYLSVYNDYLTKRHRPPVSKSEFRSLGIMKIAQKERLPKWQLFWIVILGRRYTARHISEFQPIRGIESELKLLSQKHTLGIVSSNSRKNISVFLKSHNLYSQFSFIESKITYFGKAQKLSHVLHKYDIPKENALYVGDETRDITAAKTVGLRSVAVTWGVENVKLISKSQPDITITKPSLLSKSITQLVQKNM